MKPLFADAAYDRLTLVDKASYLDFVVEIIRPRSWARFSLRRSTAAGIHPVHLEHRLGQVQADRAHPHFG